MELRNLVSFSKVAELGSFSKAADALGYTQSTITAQVKQLESELGVMLFDRYGKHVYLTEMGKNILNDVEKMILAANHIKTITQDKNMLNGKIFFGTLFSIYVPTLPPLIQQFHRECPNVELNLKLGVTKELISMLNNNRIDILMILDKEIDNVHWVKLAECYTPSIFICSPHHRLAWKQNVELDDILNEEFILTRTGCNYRYLLDNILTEQEKVITPFLESDDMPSIMDFVHDNNYLSLLPQITVQKYLDSGYLASFDVKGIKIDTWTQLFYHKSKYLTPAMWKFAKMLMRVIQTNDKISLKPYDDKARLQSNTK